MVQQGERSLNVRRLLVAAGVSLIAALGFGLAPVEQASVVYEFRPAENAPLSTSALASLALAPRLEPETLDLILSCESGQPSVFRSANLEVWQPPERGAIQSPLAYESLGGAAVVTVGGGELSLVLGGDQLLTAPVAHGPGCVARVEYANGLWRVSTPEREWTVQAAAPTLADVSFAGPAAGSPQSVITVSARELGSSPSVAQYLFLVVALGSFLFAGREILTDSGSTRREPTDGSSKLRRVLSSVGVVDAGVLGMLVLWAFVIPPAFDDGWLAATIKSQDGFAGLRVFHPEGVAVSPIGYWVEWLQHSWFSLSSSPVVMRLPNVALGLATWVGLRSIARSLGFSRRGSWLWVMGSVFVVSYGAWGMAVRKEPIVAALLVASLALALRFAAGQRGWVLVGWVLVVALAVNAHPVGLVVMAPALVVWRDIRVWVRTNRRAAYVGLASLLMLGAVTLLVFAWGANLGIHLDALSVSRAGDAHRLGIFDDSRRYWALGGASMLRRLSVVFLLLALAVFLMRRYARGVVTARPRDLPVWSLIVGLGLLTLVPSKWLWHFGAFAGLAGLAVVVAISAAPADGDGEPAEPSRFSVPMIGVLFVGLGAAMSWAWTSTEPWALFDLRIQRWWEGAVNVLPFSLASPVTWLVIAGGIAGVYAALRRRVSAHRDVFVLEVFVVVASMLAVVVTASTFVVDAVRTDGWTFTGQNVESLFGSASCGLGDEIRIPEPGSLHVLSGDPTDSPQADVEADAAGFSDTGGFALGAFPAIGVNTVRPLPNMIDVGSWGVADGEPGSNTGGLRSAWQIIGGGDEAVALMIMGGFANPEGNAVGVQWGIASGGIVEPLAIDQADLSGRFSDWTLVTFEVPTKADRVRMVVRDSTAGPGIQGWVAASLPLGLSQASIGSVAEASSPSAFVTPPLTLFLPCLTVSLDGQPVVQPPALMVREVPEQSGFTVWPRADRGAAYLAATASDRYFTTQVVIPPAEADDRVEVLFSQEYLTGSSARATGTFRIISP